jgi:Tol biopolymer transport system component
MYAVRNPVLLWCPMRNHVSRLSALGTALIVLACSRDSTAPHLGIFLTTVAGANQRDTIGATLTQALVLQVHGTSQVAGRVVSLQVTGPPAVVQAHQGSSCFVEFTPLDESVLPGCPYTTLSDANGRVAVLVTFLDTPVAGSVIATVLDSASGAAGRSDTVHFTIDPGNATGLIAAPTDTAMYVGATLGLQAYVHDRVGNRLADTVTYGPATGPVTLSGTHITASATGRAAIVARSHQYSDTTHISVVPNGTIAFGSADPNHDGIFILGLDGSRYRFLPTTGGGSLHTTWAPNGALIAFDHDIPQEELYQMRVSTIDTLGNQHDADTTSFRNLEIETFPQYSRDGQSLYFTRFEIINTAAYSEIWRVATDSLDAAPVLNQTPAWDYNASPSPDGSTLAYASSGGFDYTATIKLLNVTTGAVTNTGVTGDSPRWAPQGQSIAFLTGGTPYSGFGTLNVVQADGSNTHTVGPLGNLYEFGFDWSPDGQWLVAVNANTGHVEVINVSSGVALPLAFTTQVSSPTWRQTPN